MKPDYVNGYVRSWKIGEDIDLYRKPGLGWWMVIWIWPEHREWVEHVKINNLSRETLKQLFTAKRKIDELSRKTR